MLFKSVVEAAGATSILAASLLNYGIPLPVLVILLGLLAGYILGTHLAAAGILAPFFAPLLPQAALAPYTSPAPHFHYAGLFGITAAPLLGLDHGILRRSLRANPEETSCTPLDHAGRGWSGFF